jgi:hypothetical protein
MAGLSSGERDRLPSTLARSDEKAQETFVRTKESAEATYEDSGAAARVAYASLKHGYEKVGDHWEPKDHKGPSDDQSARHDRAKVARPSATAGGVDAHATKAHLLEVARRLDVAGRSSMRKAELVEAIERANRAATRRSS